MIRYSFDPIDVHRGDTELSVLAERIGRAASTVDGWRRKGLTADNADLLATALGFHPWQLWPEMLVDQLEQATRECDNPSCWEEFVPTRKGHRFCSERCRRQSIRGRERALQRERYRTDPEVRAKKIQQVREYRERSKRALTVARQAKYRREGDELRAKRRERYAANAEKEKARQARYRERIRTEREGAA